MLAGGALSAASGSGGSREGAPRRCSSRRSPSPRRWPAAGGATNECQGIQRASACPGRGCVVPAPARAEYLLSCPKGASIVAGLDAQATSRDVRVSFDGQLGAPVSAGRHDDALARSSARSTLGKRIRRSSRCSAASRRRAAAAARRSRARRRRRAGPAARAARADRRRSARARAARVGRVPGRRAARRRVARARVPDEEAADLAQARDSCTRARRRREAGRRDGARRPTRCRPTRTRSCRSARSARRDASRRRGSCSLLLARAARRWLRRSGSSAGRARYAVAFTNLDLLASVVASGGVAAAAGCRSRCSCSRSRRRPPRSRGRSATVHEPSEPGDRSCCSSTSRARCARTT